MNKTCCVVSTQHLYSPNCIKLSCSLHCIHVLSGHHGFLFLVELGRNESKRSVLECIWGNQDPSTNAVGGQCCLLHPSFSFMILFAHLFNNPHKEMLGDTVPLLSVDETWKTTVG